MVEEESLAFCDSVFRARHFLRKCLLEPQWPELSWKDIVDPVEMEGCGGGIVIGLIINWQGIDIRRLVNLLISL